MKWTKELLMAWIIVSVILFYLTLFGLIPGLLTMFIMLALVGTGVYLNNSN